MKTLYSLFLLLLTLLPHSQGLPLSPPTHTLHTSIAPSIRLPSQQQIITPEHKQSQPPTLQHGAFITRPTAHKPQRNRTDKHAYLDVLHKAQSYKALVDAYAYRFIALCLLALVPVSLAILWLVEWAARCWAGEDSQPREGRCLLEREKEPRTLAVDL